MLKGRYAVKSFIAGCVKCIRFSARRYIQLMGQIPEARITPSYPFLRTGVDYAGPISLRLTKSRGKGTMKGYICLFVCMVTRAIHLEVVEDCTTESFLAAFHRFTSRRGWCSDLYSDNGKYFVGADEELRQMFVQSLTFFNQINTALANQSTTWHWNPPGAPHFGGIWEAGVKSTKHHLKRVTGENILTFSELSTLLCRIEACLNSRPLLPLTDDPPDSDFLSPAHFLILRSSFVVPEGDCSMDTIPAGQRWKRITQMVQCFWKRWKYEYLPTLLPRQKWLVKNRSFQVGDVVYIRSENTPLCQWPLGRVTEVNPDRQGVSRYCTIRTSTSEYVRPGVKLVLVVPVDGEASTSAG